MRDPQRIDDILARLSAVWKRSPDLRLPQLIGNVYHIPSGADPYSVEDEEFVRTIELYYENSLAGDKK